MANTEQQVYVIRDYFSLEFTITGVARNRLLGKYNHVQFFFFFKLFFIIKRDKFRIRVNCITSNVLFPPGKMLAVWESILNCMKWVRYYFI